MSEFQSSFSALLVARMTATNTTESALAKLLDIDRRSLRAILEGRNAKVDALLACMNWCGLDSELAALVGFAHDELKAAQAKSGAVKKYMESGGSIKIKTPPRVLTTVSLGVRNAR